MGRLEEGVVEGEEKKRGGRVNRQKRRLRAMTEPVRVATPTQRMPGVRNWSGPPETPLGLHKRAYIHGGSAKEGKDDVRSTACSTPIHRETTLCMRDCASP